MKAEAFIQEKNIDQSMRILSGIAIILVVLGHLDFDVLSLGGLFPYYSFHVCIFMFISGYFYKPEWEQSVVKYIVKKAMHLLVPYYVWNLVYGIISTILSGMGFTFANRMSLYNFFCEPFLGGHQYGLNFAAWFLPALFVIEMINIIWRRVMRICRLNIEWLYFALSLIAGIACIWLAQGGHVWGLLKTPGRIIFMLPIYEFGRFYKIYLEEKEKRISSYIFIPVVIAIQFVLLLVADGAVNFSAVWCTGFSSVCVMPYLTVATGTAFWLRISRVLSSVGNCRLLSQIGAGSMHVCMHHVMVFFCINCVTKSICNLFNPTLAFDNNMFLSDVNYVYLVQGIYAWKLVYAALAIFVSLILSKIKNPLSQR